jgi:prepilin-type N-terminal cleavage/methylation domain-containing protein
MLSAGPTAGAGQLREQHGFTLVELVVAMAAGLIVATSLFTILDVSLRSTTRTFSRIDATQRARNAIDRIGNEMHSACVANTVIPVIGGTGGSGPTVLSFWSQYGNGVALTPVKHVVTFDATNHKLTDDTYAVTGGSSPDWTTALTPTSSETVLTNVDQSGSTPVFKYYSSSVTGQVLQTPAPTLTATQVRDTTSVTFTLAVRPAGGSNEDASLVPDTVTNSISLRLSPIPNAGAPNQDTKDFQPCE